MQVAERELARLGPGRGRALDLGCGAGRNAAPLARMGWEVVGLDLSWPMLSAAAERGRVEPPAGYVQLVQAPMDALPLQDRSVNLVIAHGVWNLARSTAEFRRALGEARRVAMPGALLFVFTFSRHTLAATSAPVPGEAFVFTQFSGTPQCFLTEGQLVAELDSAGFGPDGHVPLVEHNLPRPGTLGIGAPVIYEGGFRVRDPRS